MYVLASGQGRMAAPSRGYGSFQRALSISLRRSATLSSSGSDPATGGGDRVLPGRPQAVNGPPADPCPRAPLPWGSSAVAFAGPWASMAGGRESSTMEGHGRTGRHRASMLRAVRYRGGGRWQAIANLRPAGAAPYPVPGRNAGVAGRRARGEFLLPRERGIRRRDVTAQYRQWLRRRDSNPRPPGYEPDELPTALLRDMRWNGRDSNPRSPAPGICLAGRRHPPRPPSHMPPRP